MSAPTPAVRADVLAIYPFSNSSLASTDTNALSTATAIAAGSGLNGTTRFTAVGNPGTALRIGTDETDGTTFATAVTANDFFVFTLSPVSGDRLVFQNITFDLATSAATFSTSVRLQASINGSAFVTVGDVTAFSNTTYTAQTFDLTFGNNNAAIVAGASVLLRFVVFDDATNANSYTAFDNIILNGTVTPIPEPGSVALITLGVIAIGGVVMRRRKR